MLLQFIINGLINGILYSLLAIGFALVYNTTKLFHIVAAALYVFAAYMFYWFAVRLSLPVFAAGVAAILLTMVLSLLTEVAVYRPLLKRKASNNVAMIASIGMMTVIINLLAIAFGNETKFLGNALHRTFQAGSLIVTTPQAAEALIGAAAILLFLVFIHRTPWGVRFQALSADSVLYETLGHDTRRTRTPVFLMSGAFIALGSCLSAYDIGLNQQMGMTALTNAMVAMIIGGVGRFGTCVLGGLSLGLLQALAVSQFTASWESGITFIVLILLLFLRPQGIAGRKMRTV